MSDPAADLPRPDRCVIMGVINVTPDSFSDGGRYTDSATAIQRGFELVKAATKVVKKLVPPIVLDAARLLRGKEQ
mgnify:CR=1 FL=1